MKLTRRFVSSFTQRLGCALAVVLCSAMASPAWADPPGRVGRLGELNGQVWLYSPDAGEWVTAERNRPLTTGDRLATDNNARAEVRIGSTTVRLDAGTELEIVAIDDDQIALQLHGGSIATRLRDAEAANEFELRTAEGRFTVHRPGRYRFDRRDASSHVTVWNGEAVYEGPGSALTVYAGQRAEFWIDNNAAQYTLTDPVRDSFAAWTDDRDRRDERSASQRYVSPEMTGVEDLDRYGQWQQVPDYGTVWVPQVVPVGWVPYRTGHWVWVSPWGWTWVDDMPWGFAPFHYGRWAYVSTRWCWVPGTYVRRPVYAPALVGWVGGSNVDISVSIGNRHAPAVGWFPLAPREVYVPTYRVSPGYVQNINITHVTRIVNVTTIVNNPQGAVTQYDYANRRHHHAVTVVPQDVMINRQPVAPAAAKIAPTAIVQQLINQPAQKVMLPAAPVAAPPAVEARRMHIHGEAGRPAAAAIPPAPVATPAPPMARFIPPNMRQAQQPPAAAAPAAPATPATPARPQALAAPQPPVAVAPPANRVAPQPPVAVAPPANRVVPQPPVAVAPPGANRVVPQPPVAVAPPAANRVVPPPPVTQGPGTPPQPQGQGRSHDVRTHPYRGRQFEQAPPAQVAQPAPPPAQPHVQPAQPRPQPPQAQPQQVQPQQVQPQQVQPQQVQGRGRSEARAPGQGREARGHGREEHEARNERREQMRERAN